MKFLTLVLCRLGLLAAGCLLCANLVLGGDADDTSPAPEVAPEIPDLMVNPLLPTTSPILADGTKYDHVDWRGVLGQSLRFMLIQQAFRLATEESTRHPHSGFFAGYRDSVTNLHGWADGDPFIVNYVGHPMQGAVSGFIWVQNDGRYRFAEFGANREYWRSRMRAAAFSYCYSVIFEIGPLSEASIGNTQKYFPQQGFVDHVVTPTIGLGWMLAEDSIDKYFIKWYETKTNNRFYIMMIRSWLNPSRSFSNIIGGEVPWHRENRVGLFGSRQTFQPVKLPPIPPPNQDQIPRLAPLEFSVFPKVVLPLGDTVSGPCAGAGADLAVRLAARLQMVLNVDGCKMTGLYTNLSGDMLNFLLGPRWTFGTSTRWIPYVQVQAGGMKLTHEEMYPEQKAQLQALWASQGRTLGETEHNLYTRQAERSGFAMAIGIGVDRKLNNALSWRVASVDFTRAWVGYLDGYNYTNGLQISSGLVLKMGTW